ncbi:hypothetical protein HNQ80_000842 [Anaerosolibacter carboniphilus]|uniref:Uncharacterized protein n=1 Tax=Anaerosolibacter carboniphilus TaxID=1417629 RepID=A0A841KX47_9FIRM|nr:hypothetical protein [Anaerosolibacter carboniphilus]MBB6214759.1 hypothetical protein [Anaerosolibacter carboniphilus]
MRKSKHTTPYSNNSKIAESYYKPIEDPYYRLGKNPYYNTPVENPYNGYSTQNPIYPANSNNAISINITPEHLLAMAGVFIVLFTQGENLNIKDFINNLDIGKILNILGNFKTEESNSNMSPIISMLSKTKGGQSIVSDININPSNLKDIIKQAVEIANELKKDPNIVDTIKSSKEKVDTNTIENIINKLKNLDGHKNIDPSNLESIVEQVNVIANELKKNNV